MGFLDFVKRPAPCHDRLLGVLTRSGRYWEGTIALAGHGTVDLRLSGTRTEPDAASLALGRELPRRIDALIPAIQEALFEHYEPYRDGVAAGEHPADPDPMPAVAAPKDVWTYVTPCSVTIEPLSGVATIEIAYTTGWDVEHTVGARIQNWALVELCGSV